MSTIKKKFRLVKYLVNLLLLTSLVYILFQNHSPIPVELLAWEVDISLSFLLLAVALLGALITFISVLIIGNR